MKLFSKFQSRPFQFALDLLVEMEQAGTLTATEINQLVGQYGLDYADQVLMPLLSAGIVEKGNDCYRLADGVKIPALPISDVEKEYLQYILRLPVASLFLEEDILSELINDSENAVALQSIQHYESSGESLPEEKPVFRMLLKAIREKRLIRNYYFVRGEEGLKESVVLPWKLEYDTIDYRWWVILYHLTEKRMIKARVKSFRNVELLGIADVTDEEVAQAMESLLEPEPVVLRVNNIRGALERCFLVFEGQLFEETRKLSGHYFELKFRYYRFDRNEILRKLLYLGSPVTLVKPESMRKELLGMVMQALQHQ